MRMVLLITCFAVFASGGASAASLITNGSFEGDGHTIGDITSTAPVGWNVNIGSKFGGNIRTEWRTHRDYSLRLYTVGSTTFTAGENAVISQQVDLTDANEIIFDINLTGYRMGTQPWDSNKVTAFINIDSNNVWQSGPSYNGTYYDISVPIDSYSGIHVLGLGIRVNIGQHILPSYWAQWDFVKFDAFCGGFGHFDSDFNRDCYVDFYDVDILAQNWLRSDLVPADDLIDVWQDGKINLSDFAELANQWLLCTDWQDANCVEIPLALDADINLDGIVNMLDYSILIANWGVPTNLKADINGSGTVDYSDLAIMNAQWLEKSWLYKY
ncbi:MAG: dockerin type I domain-containing protein [Phycisphaerae bacterium]